MLSFNVAAEGRTILLLGDSLSAGYGLKVADSWPQLLQKQLQASKQPALANVSLHNASVSGKTSAEGAAEIDQLLANVKPDMLILELGANDGLRGLSITQMQQNLSSIIEKARKQNVKVLLLGMHIPPNYGRRYTKMFHESFATLADRHGIGLVPFMLEPVAAQSQYILPDGLHPNTTAQPLILDHLWPQIEATLQNLTR